MQIFDAMDAAGSGLTTYRTWLDAIADNVANVNTVRPANEDAFQAEYVQAQSKGPEGNRSVGGGVRVSNIVKGSAEGRMEYSPNDPLADQNGYIRVPDIDLGEQMTDMIIAQRSFQANAATVDRVRDSYQAAIDIGKKI
jgi:flagellar basal-body rod protein FlgC